MEQDLEDNNNMVEVMVANNNNMEASNQSKLFPLNMEKKEDIPMSLKLFKMLYTMDLLISMLPTKI